jgi:hypothetical protein
MSPDYVVRVSDSGLALASLAALLALYAIFVLVLVALGRRSEARAVAGFIPDCLVLFRRLLADERVPRSRKLALVLLIGYLALPIDLIPDFIPVAVNSMMRSSSCSFCAWCSAAAGQRCSMSIGLGRRRALS